jgi:hypothetical protein
VLALNPLSKVRLLCPDCADDRLFKVTLLPLLPAETNESWVPRRGTHPGWTVLQMVITCLQTDLAWSLFLQLKARTQYRECISVSNPAVT